jgi:hypothetical protein
MNNQPAFDRSLLVPIFISGCSVIGIVVVLLIGRALSAPPEVPLTPSATRFAYVYLGTEPAITTPMIDGTQIEEPIDEPTEDPIFEEPTFEEPTDAPPVLTTPTRPGANTPIILPSATGNTPGTPTATSASAPPLLGGTYDDTHPVFVYNGWTETSSGGTTLHVSTVPNSTMSFRFIGTQLRLRYDGGNTLGQLRVTIDNVSETLDQSDGDDEWVWPNSLSNVTHTVLITHIGGGGVNIDEVIILAPGTPTPTRTPTQS